MKSPLFIAEIKICSPFGFKSKYPFSTLMDIAITEGDWISVHTNALWGGDMDAISFVRRNTNKPILAKGIHATEDDVKRAIDHGADYVLVVDNLLVPHALRKQVLLEINDPNFVNDPIIKNERIKSKSSVHRDWKYVCNSRDLRTGLPKATDDLNLYLDAGVWVCQASGISSPEDVRPNVNAFIVGEHLVEFCQRRAKW
jgi:indole-3-glycerol phosphate synthase